MSDTNNVFYIQSFGGNSEVYIDSVVTTKCIGFENANQTFLKECNNLESEDFVNFLQTITTLYDKDELTKTDYYYLYMLFGPTRFPFYIYYDVNVKNDSVSFYTSDHVRYPYNINFLGPHPLHKLYNKFVSFVKENCNSLTVDSINTLFNDTDDDYYNVMKTRFNRDSLNKNSDYYDDFTDEYNSWKDDYIADYIERSYEEDDKENESDNNDNSDSDDE
jgi:hypothetical protein